MGKNYTYRKEILHLNQQDFTPNTDTKREYKS